MGDFSRDPAARLQHAVGEHYVGVRLQQGVPILDADWNELEDLRRHELASLAAWLIGDGTPTGSDGFRIAPVAGGGVGTIVLTAGGGAGGERLSTLTIDLDASTAAEALGFGPGNATAARYGSSPARLTGNRAQPFPLADGQTLTVRVDDGPAETVTFNTGDFPDISAATAAQIVSVLSPGGAAALATCTVAAGTGNDFVIRGAPGLAGALLVDGRLVRGERDLKYTEQPLFMNDALAAAWQVAAVPALAAPPANTLFVVYLDVWDREVDSAEDPDLVDPRVGVETAVRLRREWAVRVAEALAYPEIAENRPAGHVFYPLAELARTAAPGITAAMIADRRETDASLRREVAYRDARGVVLVDSARFRSALVTLRNNVRGFIDFLTGRFVDPGAAYLAGEVAGIDALSAIAALADHGVALLDTRVMGTRGALDFFEQLHTAEDRFVRVWRDAVLPIVKQTGDVYQRSYGSMLDAIEEFLNGPPPAGFTAVTQALQQRNLMEATRSQEQINNQLGREVGRPSGSLRLTYLGSPAPLVQRNVPFDTHWAVAGSVTPDDDLDVQVMVGAGWQTTLRNEDGSVPFALRFGPGEDEGRFRITIRPPDVAAAETALNVRVSARENSGALYHNATPKTIRIGDPPPASEEDFALTFTSGVPFEGGAFRVPTGTSGIVTFHLANNTDQALTANLAYEPVAHGLWGIVRGSFGLENQAVPANGSRAFSFQFTAPGAPDNTLEFAFRVRDAGTDQVRAETQITLVSVG